MAIILRLGKGDTLTWEEMDENLTTLGNMITSVDDTLTTAVDALTIAVDGKRADFTVLPIDEGGTGAITAAAARSNLDISAANIPSATTTGITATNVQAAINELAAEKSNLATTVTKDSDTGAARISSGTTAQRPAGQNGDIRHNSTTGGYEGFKNGDWLPLGGGATGAGTNDVFYENSTTVTADYTITAGKNAMTAGPITVNNGVTVTVPNGSTWSIV